MPCWAIPACWLRLLGLVTLLDPVTGKPVWVVPLTWSHAMYVLLILKLYA
jgi:hypothetical protein